MSKKIAKSHLTALYQLHKVLGRGLNHLAHARKALAEGDDIYKFAAASLNDARAAWQLLTTSRAVTNGLVSAKSATSLKRTKKQVDQAIEAAEAYIHEASDARRAQRKLTKKTQREISRALIRLLEAVLNQTSAFTPRLPVEELLRPITGKGTSVTDISFDIFCPRAYKHHTRLTIWMPRIIAHGDHALKALKKGRAMLKSCGVTHVDQYVIGLNSRVNQYRQQHLLMLDFDDITYEDLPRKALAGEPGVLMRTATGFHFLGLKLYDQKTWTSKLRTLRKVASSDHIDLSLQRGYATLRMTASPRKPFAPIVYEHWT